MAHEQCRRRRCDSLIALVVGALLRASLAGPIVRTMPASWLLPEWMAARSLRMPMWEGGRRLMRAGNAEAFAGMLARNRLVTTNRETLAACRRQAAKAGKTVRCVIQVGAGV